MRSLCWFLALTTVLGCAKLGYRSRSIPPPAESLAVGSPAPEIRGQDVDGVPFKLSDYRGKVVILDFWGLW